MADDLTPHVPILQPGSLMCICGYRGNDPRVHPADTSEVPETPNQGRGVDLDRTEGDVGPIVTAADAGAGGHHADSRAAGVPDDGPVGHDHGGAASEPEPTREGDRPSVRPATAPADAEQHAEALWHTLWFHTLEMHATHRDAIGPDDPDALMFDSDEEREAYNAYQAERDIDAEVDRHRRTVAACRDAYRRWGVDLPDDDTVIAHPTYASWRTSPTEEVPHGDR